MNQSSLASYDEILYPSRTYRQSRPDQLASVGRMFGLQPADFRSARVLELGCASGGNLIPMAAVFSDSRFIGIDLSKKQIEVGQQDLSELDLDNIELKLLSIMDVDESFGTFDYIIAHGLYSWVPEDERDR